jgi:pimeloyl-ACP methyl ester carboxylesterase
MATLKLDDCDLHYDVSGSGPVMLLIAGTATHGEIWKQFQVPEFSKDHTVVTYDPRGTGQSKARSNDFSGKRQAEDAVALLDHLKLDRAVVWGHSMGGRIAQVLALDHPGKVGKLVLASTGASFTSRGVPISMAMGMIEKGYQEWLREHCTDVGFSDAYRRQHPKELEAFMKVRLSMPPSVETYLRHVIARQELDTSARLKDIKVPTLILLGEDEDRPSSSGITHQSSSQALAKGIPGAKFVIIPGHGHYYPFSDPITTNREVRRFLAA